MSSGTFFCGSWCISTVKSQQHIALCFVSAATIEYNKWGGGGWLQKTTPVTA